MIAQEEIEIVKALEAARKHIRTDKNLYNLAEDDPILAAAIRVQDALEEADAIREGKNADYALDEAIDLA